MKKITYILIAIAFIVLALFIFKPLATEYSVDTLTIGAILPLTGEASPDGEDFKRAIELAVGDLKEKGISLRVVYEDDETDPKKTVSALHRLAQKDIHAVIGGVWSFLAEAIVPTSEQTETVVVGPVVTREYVSGTSQYFFLAGTENSKKSGPLTEWLRENNHKTAAIIVSKDGWGQSNGGAFKQAVQNVDGEVLMYEEVPFLSEKDTIPTLVAKIGSLNPDVILWTGYDAGAVTLIRRLNDQNLNIPVVGATVAIINAVEKGLVEPNPGFQLYALDYSVPKEFDEKFIAAYGQKPLSSYAHRAYDSVFLLVENMQVTDSADELKEAVRSNGYVGYGGEYIFTEDGSLQEGSEWIIKKVN